jgi:hypothetical protein
MAMSLSIANKRLMLLNPKYVQAKRATTGFATLDHPYGNDSSGLDMGDRHPGNRSAINFNSSGAMKGGR